MDFLSRFCLMRVSDIAESWKTTAHFVEELIAKHELPVVLLDGQIRICVADAIERNDMSLAIALLEQIAKGDI
jgi:hypothetical protein